jgi:hypothetical protein
VRFQGLSENTQHLVVTGRITLLEYHVVYTFYIIGYQVIFFQEKCINIVCYPGRALVNETCRPLLTYTSNLGYVITFGADIQHNMTIKYPESFLEYLRYEILLYIERVVGIEYRFLEFAVLKANKTCNSNDVWSDSSEDLLRLRHNRTCILQNS